MLNKDDYRALVGMYIAATACEKVGRADIAKDYWIRIYKSIDMIQLAADESDLFVDDED